MSGELLTAEEVLRRLKAGETIWNARIGVLEFPNTKICCGLSIRNSTIEHLDLSSCTVEASVQLDGCIIKQRALVKNAHFEQQATFRRVTFIGGCDFTGARFDRRTHFNMAIFEGWSTFKDARFHGRTLFSKAHFRAGIEFRNCVFTTQSAVAEKLNNYSFNDMSCDMRFHMQECRFDDNVTFTGSRFADVTDFDGSCFHRNVRIKHAQFIRSVSFRDALFGKEMHLNGTSTEGDVIFDRTRFRGLINLRAMVGQRNVDFHLSIIEDKSTFQIEKAHFSRLLIDRVRIERHLASYLNNDYETARREFGLLKNSFRDINAYKDEDWAYLMEKRMERLATPVGSKNITASVKRFFNWLVLDLGCGYGTKPINVFITSIVMLLVFAAIYYVPTGHFTSQSPSDRISVFAALELSFKIFTNAEISSADPRSSSWLKLVMMFESFLGFFVMMVLVVTYSRKVIR
jgi:hypothetical protein